MTLALPLVAAVGLLVLLVGRFAEGSRRGRALGPWALATHLGLPLAVLVLWVAVRLLPMPSVDVGWGVLLAALVLVVGWVAALVLEVLLAVLRRLDR